MKYSMMHALRARSKLVYGLEHGDKYSQFLQICSPGGVNSVSNRLIGNCLTLQSPIHRRKAVHRPNKSGWAGSIKLAICMTKISQGSDPGFRSQLGRNENIWLHKTSKPKLLYKQEARVNLGYKRNVARMISEGHDAMNE